MKAISNVRNVLSVKYPNFKFSITSKGDSVVVGILASPYNWDSMYDVIDKENQFVSIPNKYYVRKGVKNISARWKKYNDVMVEKAKYWDKNGISVVGVTSDIDFDFDAFVGDIRSVYSGKLDIRLGSLYGDSRPRVLSQSDIDIMLDVRGKMFSKSFKDATRSRLSERESDSLRFGSANCNSNAVRMKKSQGYY